MKLKNKFYIILYKMGVVCFKYNNTVDDNRCAYYCGTNCFISWIFLMFVFMIFLGCCLNICINKNRARRRVIYVTEDPNLQELVVEGRGINNPPKYSDI